MKLSGVLGRMFPALRISFNGIDAQAKYAVLLDIVPVDNRRYRYSYRRSSWLVAGRANPSFLSRLYLHSDSPFTGDQLEKQVISFEKVKLTNNEKDNQGHIILNSMHKYQPRIHLVKLRSDLSNLLPITDLEAERSRTYIFSETVFIAVTAYQNQLVTKLKIDSNPFAKGFRDSSRLTDLERGSMETFLQDHIFHQAPFQSDKLRSSPVALSHRAALPRVPLSTELPFMLSYESFLKMSEMLLNMPEFSFLMTSHHQQPNCLADLYFGFPRVNLPLFSMISAPSLMTETVDAITDSAGPSVSTSGHLPAPPELLCSSYQRGPNTVPTITKGNVSHLSNQTNNSRYHLSSFIHKFKFHPYFKPRLL
ncbi:T-box transcription factor TBX20-like [Limulus polyphemus]|uniref:T-box transcription factor TBX20-like n=1 Tax=Limulus polyphemus TaxID=6850 RepID=A0ABM1BPN6_LIMPO|nr:T-box transcription factor TBX20-like [Limulus polyphemus]